MLKGQFISSPSKVRLDGYSRVIKKKKKKTRTKQSQNHNFKVYLFDRYSNNSYIYLN